MLTSSVCFDCCRKGQGMGVLDGRKAVLFDLDGTIVDSLGIWSRVDVELAHALGCPDPDPLVLHRLREEALERFKDDPQPYTAFCGEFGRFFGSPLSAREIHAKRYEISRRVLKNEVGLKPGVAQVIRALHAAGLKLAIVTTTKRANVDIYCDVNERIRREIHLRDFFSTVVTMEDVSRIKPDPEGYLLALNRLGAGPEQALVIEDSRAGLLAAHAAGIEAAVIREPFSEAARPWLMQQADYYFEDALALMKALRLEEDSCG